MIMNTTLQNHRMLYTPKFKDYVGFNEIKEINETEDTYEITTKDGNIYTVDK